MNLSNEVFERYGVDRISTNIFYGLIGLFVVYGLGGTAFVAHQLALIHYMPNGWEKIIFGLVVPFAGIFLALTSEKPILSFIGYNMVLVPFGVILAPIVNHYRPEIIERAFMITGGATLVMMFVSLLAPKFFSSIGSALFIALLGLLCVKIAENIFPFLEEMTWIDYVAGGIFCLYIGYDMWRARNVQRTLDNAIDIALALYLDILNLFLIALSGGKKSSSSSY